MTYGILLGVCLVTHEIPVSSVYNIFRHPVQVKLWVKILCNTITHEQQVHYHSIIVSEKNILIPIPLKKTRTMVNKNKTEKTKWLFTYV